MATSSILSIKRISSRKIICFLVMLSFTILFSSCNITAKKETVSDLAYTKTGSANLVYVKEDDQYLPFVVVTDDYSGDTLLIRKDVLAEQRRVNDCVSYYKDSEMDRFLNNEYLKRLSEIEPYIVSSDIVITADCALGLSGTETETISRKIFLLSCSELGLDNLPNAGIEGKPLKYFRNVENRKASLNGNTSCWWLRTPNTYYLSCTYVIGANNKIGSTNSYDENGVRPAFCVSGDTRIELKSGIIENNQAYVFSTEKSMLK